MEVGADAAMSICGPADIGNQVPITLTKSGDWLAFHLEPGWKLQLRQFRKWGAIISPGRNRAIDSVSGEGRIIVRIAFYLVAPTFHEGRVIGFADCAPL